MGIPDRPTDMFGNDLTQTDSFGTCRHPLDKLIAYTEDGVRYRACRSCKEIWELDPDSEEANEA